MRVNDIYKKILNKLNSLLYVYACMCMLGSLDAPYDYKW